MTINAHSDILFLLVCQVISFFQFLFISVLCNLGFKSFILMEQNKFLNILVLIT